MELRRTLFEKGARAFPHVFGGGANSEQRRFEELSFLLRHFPSAFDGLHRELHRERSIRNDLFCQRFRRGQKLRRLVNVIDETDTKRFVGRNHFSRQAQFVRYSLAAQAGKPLGPAIAREDSKFHFGLSELRSLARQPHRARKRHFASAAKREAIDRRDGGFSHRFQTMQHALTKQRSLSSAHGSLHRQFADIRTGHEGLFSRARQDERAYVLVFSSGNQNLIQFFHRLPIQRVQHFLPGERKEANSVPLFIEQIFVSHPLASPSPNKNFSGCVSEFRSIGS